MVLSHSEAELYSINQLTSYGLSIKNKDLTCFVTAFIRACCTAVSTADITADFNLALLSRESASTVARLTASVTAWRIASVTASSRSSGLRPTTCFVGGGGKMGVGTARSISWNY